jgi:hydrogenase nickel insertion protein HypA
MHEFSVISSMVDVIKSEMEKHDNLICVKEVVLEVGELTFLGPEALQFGYKSLTESSPKINSGGLKIVQIPASVKCKACHYAGPMKLDNDEEHHVSIPIFVCPSCEGAIDVIKGKECIVRNLVLDLEDD